MTKVKTKSTKYSIVSNKCTILDWLKGLQDLYLTSKRKLISRVSNKNFYNYISYSKTYKKRFL